MNLPVRNRSFIDPQHYNLRGTDNGWPLDMRKASGHRDPLRAICRVRDHTPANCAVKRLAPKLLSGGRVERVEVAANIAEEQQAAGRWRPTPEDRVVGSKTPLPHACVRVRCVHPAAPMSIGLGAFTEHPEGIERRHPRPGFPK